MKNKELFFKPDKKQRQEGEDIFFLWFMVEAVQKNLGKNRSISGKRVLLEGFSVMLQVGMQKCEF